MRIAAAPNGDALPRNDSMSGGPVEDRFGGVKMPLKGKG